MEKSLGVPLPPPALAAYREWFSSVVLRRRLEAMGACGCVGLLSTLAVLPLLSLQLLWPWPLLKTLFWSLLSPTSLALAALSGLLAAGTAALHLLALNVGGEGGKVDAYGKRGTAVVVQLLTSLLTAFYALAASYSKFNEDEDGVWTFRRLLVWCLVLENVLDTVSLLQSHYRLQIRPQVGWEAELEEWLGELRQTLIRRVKLLARVALPSYYILGWWILPVGVKRSLSETVWDSVDPFLWLALLTLLAHHVVAHTLSFRLISYFLTKPLGLEASAPGWEAGVGGPPPLTVALQMRDEPLLYCLAYLDLAKAAATDRKQRARIFAVSQPGGHPWEWLGVWRGVSTVLEEGKVAFAAEAARASGDAVVAVEETGVERQKLLQPTHLRPNPPREEVGGVRVRTESVRRVDVDARVVAWAVEAVGSLAVASRSEDEFGVVQGDLASILRALIDLHVAVHRYARLKGFTGRPNGAGNVWGSEVRHLRNSLSTALLKLNDTFGENLRFIGLSEEYSGLLESFVRREQTT